MPRIPDTHGRPWPPLMRAETAAGYCDEVSVESFLRRVGRYYPEPHNISGRGRVWVRAELDEAIASMTGARLTVGGRGDAGDWL